MKITIAFTMKNLWELTGAAINSIVTTYPHDVIVVDDWSDDRGTIRWLQTVEGPLVITEPMTQSLSGKWNIAAETAWSLGSAAVLICNNDILFSPVTIDAIMLRYLQGGTGMVTAHNLRGAITPDEIFKATAPETPSESEGPDFSCFLLPKTTWDIVGKFDEEFIPCYFEDNDYHYRMKKAGLKAITTTAAPYYHYGSRTQNSIPGGLCEGYQFEKNRAYFVKKHGVDPSTYEPVWD